MQSKTVQVLLIEDDEVDAEGVRRAFDKKHIANPLMVVQDGVEALAVLRGEQGFQKLHRPFMILLDLNLPRMNGIEFLQQLRADANLKDSIVFVLTTSADTEDKKAAYDYNVAGYLVKANVGEEFLSVTELLDCFWRLVEFP